MSGLAGGTSLSTGSSMTARLLVGDARDRIREIPDNSIDLICTSPPFLALRKYGDGPEMGSEANPAAFIDALLDLTAEFRRVLAPHGSIAIELGDTYSGSGGAGGDYNDNGLREGQEQFLGSAKRARIQHPEIGPPLKWNGVSEHHMPTKGNGWPLAKSLAGVPEAFMLSLAYGYNVLNRHGPDSPAGRWRVRNVIVWARPNPPVGALGDKVRPATSYITVACTSDRRWFDLDAVRTPGSENTHARLAKGTDWRPRTAKTPPDGNRASMGEVETAGAPPLDWWEDNDPTGHATLIQPTHPYPGAHYATWPPTLAKRLIDMMCPLRVCTVCGEPSRRIVEKSEEYAAVREQLRSGDPASMTSWSKDVGNRASSFGTGGGAASLLSNGAVSAVPVTLGWTDCGHNQWRQGHVLDPFAGSGTTLAVAQGCGRTATGIELYQANADLIADRLGMFLEVVA